MAPVFIMVDYNHSTAVTSAQAILTHAHVDEHTNTYIRCLAPTMQIQLNLPQRTRTKTTLSIRPMFYFQELTCMKRTPVLGEHF